MGWFLRFHLSKVYWDHLQLCDNLNQLASALFCHELLCNFEKTILTSLGDLPIANIVQVLLV